MDRLSAFLNPATGEETREVMISKRFLGEDGSPVPFTIKALTQEESDAIRRQSRRRDKKGRPLEEIDTAEFASRMVLAATVEPDFSRRELCEKFGVLDPTQVPGKMLLAGEFSALLGAITKLSGFDRDSLEALEEEAKN